MRDGVIRIQASGKTSAHLFFAGDLKEGFERFKNFEFEVMQADSRQVKRVKIKRLKQRVARPPKPPVTGASDSKEAAE